jgi:hypothetical protein
MGISKMKTHQKKHKQWAHKQQQQPLLMSFHLGDAHFLIFSLS